MLPTILLLLFSLPFFSSITLERRLRHTEELEVLEITEDNDFIRPMPNNRPLIGVLTQPSAWPKFFDPDDFSYIAASYVKYLEAAGARVVPIKYNMNHSELEKIFQTLNGLLLPGGGSDLLNDKTENFTEFYESGNFLLNLARKTNENGEYFPVWGTCLGFEMMVLSVAGDKKILSVFNSTNHSMKLKFLKSTLMSKMFSRMREKMKYYLSHENFMYFNHKFGIDIKNFNQNHKVKDFFDILTINTDKNGKSFVSAIEAKEFPFYGVQFHPEKNSFEWQEHLEINHSPGAIEVQQYFANFFVNEARKNPRSFNNSKEEKKELISNFYSIPLSESFVNIYIFTKPPMRDLFKLNIHSKRFLNFIQNFKHSNNETLNHSSNSSHNNNNNNNRENSSNKSAGFGKDNKNGENETNVTNDNNNSNISKELNSFDKGKENDANQTKTEKDQNLNKTGEIQEKNETNAIKSTSVENDKTDVIKNKEFDKKNSTNEIGDASNQKSPENSALGEEKNTTKNINNGFLKVAESGSQKP